MKKLVVSNSAEIFWENHRRQTNDYFLFLEISIQINSIISPGEKNSVSTWVQHSWRMSCRIYSRARENGSYAELSMPKQSASGRVFSCCGRWFIGAVLLKPANIEPRQRPKKAFSGQILPYAVCRDAYWVGNLVGLGDVSHWK